ncbi:YdaU family protein [Sulfitobacter sp. 20_GPM-1509m]|uniref:YdaU family protein n=1 Tax=Sulfitobacter sp. 20_GPM-1509m TaxID=1380367 RepID=UPI0009E010AE|nr:YdaU family protein [Sulfitobacter sp. 20_GPM-1509m]
MSNLPYYPRYPRDFFEGTAGMSLEEKGAYGLVLDLIYMMGARGLPDDPQYIAGQIGTSVRKWNSLRKSLIERGKLYADNGIISNKRADKVKIKQRSYQDNQAENARGSSKNKDLEKPSPTYREDTDTDKNKIDDDSAREDLTFREQVLVKAGHPASGITATGKIVGNQADMAALNRAMTDLGLSQSEVLAVVAETAQRKRDGPPSSLNYFIEPLRKFAGAKNAPKIKAIDGGRNGERTSKSEIRQHAFIGGATGSS